MKEIISPSTKEPHQQLCRLTLAGDEEDEPYLYICSLEEAQRYDFESLVINHPNATRKTVIPRSPETN